MLYFNNLFKKILAFLFLIVLATSSVNINTNAYVLDGVGAALLQCSISGIAYQNNYGCNQQSNYCGVNAFLPYCDNYGYSINSNQTNCSYLFYSGQTCFNINYETCGNVTVSGSIEDVSFFAEKYGNGGQVNVIAKVYSPCQFSNIPVVLTVVENNNKVVVKEAVNVSTFDTPCNSITPQCKYLQAAFYIPNSIGNNYKVYASFQNDSNYFVNNGNFSVTDTRINSSKTTEYLVEPGTIINSCDYYGCNIQTPQTPCFNPYEITSFCY
jgi:hypothetical protein